MVWVEAFIWVLAHKGKHAAITSETLSQPKKRGFLWFSSKSHLRILRTSSSQLYIMYVYILYNKRSTPWIMIEIPCGKRHAHNHFKESPFYDLLSLFPVFFEGKTEKNALFCNKFKKKVEKFVHFIKKP